MNRKTVQLLDLPDEILLIIIKNLDSMDVLYSLLGVNKRLDQMTKTDNHTKFVDCSTTLSNNKFNRLFHEILPEIHNNVTTLSLNHFSMKHILHAYEYPNLSMIIFNNFLPCFLSRDLSDKPSTASLFREQITHIAVKIKDPRCWSHMSFTNACAYIIAMYTKLSYLNINQPLNFTRLQVFFLDPPLNMYHSSHLRTLIIDTAHFDECLYLLDGRLEQLSSFTVNIHSIEPIAIIGNSQKIISNLKEFSLTCYTLTNAYGRRILPLLRRMTNLNSLSLYLNIKRLRIIDGIHFNEKLLPHMLNLNTFIFHIHTITSGSLTNLLLSTNVIQNTFINWKYSPVSCCIAHFSDKFISSHIYSTPFEMNYFINITNHIPKHNMEFITILTLYDTCPYEHDFFLWISQTFRLLQNLIIQNLKPQKRKYQNESINDKQILTKIPYLHLIQLRLIDAHIDYAYQFLCYTNAFVPNLRVLKIQYEKLVTVTNNFTNEITRHNCGQIKQLVTNKLIDYSEHFYFYFPSLEKKQTD